MRRALWIVVALLVLVACTRGSSSGSYGLLQGLSSFDERGVKRAALVNDGELVRVGDFWDTDKAAVFSSRDGFVVFDLGERHQIVAALIQADHNDEYLVSLSDDGRRFRPVWTAPAVGGDGMQVRHADDLEGTGRYVRLQARRGDGAYAVSELMLFEHVPDPFPPRLKANAGLPEGERVRSSILAFGLALGLFVLLAYQGAPLWWLSLLLVFPVFTATRLGEALLQSWPVDGGAVSMVRGMTALVAAVAILREAFAPKRFPADARAVIGTLSVCAGLALAAFFNLGHPQFHDAGKDQPTVVHSFDLRVYFPVAKYFPELRFDGVYLGSVAAYVDDDPGVTLDSLGSVEFRDLRTHRMTRVANSHERIEEVRERFSPERWESFKRDMRYFRELMGRDKYLRSMQDHGGNATPVWTTIAHLLFAHVEASDTALILTGLLDPLLLLLAFAAIARAFGVRTMLVCMVVFGANDFYMFFSNWAGATLRHDWMAYLALGIAALKLRRYALGGAFLALASLIRAFPALALTLLAVPFFYWLVAHLVKHRRLPGRRLFVEQQSAFLRVVLGALACVVFFVGLSVVVFDFAAWTEWIHKVTLLESGAHTNHISLRGLVAGAEGDQAQLLRARLPVFFGLGALYLGVVGALAARAKLHRAATLGLVLIPVLFNPANYYLHFVFLLPLLADERPRPEPGAPRPPIPILDADVWLSLLLMCMALYWTTLDSFNANHFQLATAIFFAHVSLALLLLVRRDLLKDRLVCDTPPGSLALAGVPSEQEPPPPPGAPSEGTESDSGAVQRDGDAAEGVAGDAGVQSDGDTAEGAEAPHGDSETSADSEEGEPATETEAAAVSESSATDLPNLEQPSHESPATKAASGEAPANEAASGDAPSTESSSEEHDAPLGSAGEPKGE